MVCDGHNTTSLLEGPRDSRGKYKKRTQNSEIKSVSSKINQHFGISQLFELLQNSELQYFSGISFLEQILQFSIAVLYTLGKHKIHIN